MWASFAASIRFIPFGATTSLPSMVSLTVMMSGMSVLLRSVAVLARLLEFAAVLGYKGFHRPSGSFAERTDRFAVDVVRNIPQQVHILGAAVAVFDAMEHFLHPQRAFAARRALAARLMRIELRDVERALDDIDRVIQHNHPARARHRAGFAQRLEIERHINLVGLQHGHRAAT